MPPTGCVGPERLVRALESFFFFLLFFFILTTPTAYGCHPRHRHAIYFTHTAPTGCVGPERVVRALQVSFFFFTIVFFYSNYTHSLCMSPTCHILHPYGTHRLRR